MTCMPMSLLLALSLFPFVLAAGCGAAPASEESAASAAATSADAFSYEAYATDPRRSVVLRFADRVVVVTPDDPSAFVEAVNAVRNALR